MNKFLRLDPFYFANLHSLMLNNHHIDSTETLTTIALLTYGLYTTTNTLRQLQQKGKPYNGEYAYDMLIQHTRNGALGHQHSMSVISNRWSNNYQTTPIHLPSNKT